MVPVQLLAAVPVLLVVLSLRPCLMQLLPPHPSSAGSGRHALPEGAVHAELRVPGGSARLTTNQTPAVLLPLLVTVARIHTVYMEVLPRHGAVLARSGVLRVSCVRGLCKHIQLWDIRGRLWFWGGL